MSSTLDSHSNSDIHKHELHNDSPDTYSIGVDLDNNNISSTEHQRIHKLENLVDSILNRVGPPKSSLGNPGPLGLGTYYYIFLYISLCHALQSIQLCTQACVLY